MTIAVCVKVHDGLVLAADSASTLMEGISVINVYNNANKVFNLYKGLPIGVVTWGAGGIGPASISTLMKDLRNRLMGRDQNHQEYRIDRTNYTMEDVSQKTRRFFFEENYLTVFQNQPPNEKPPLGFMLAGYSSRQGLPEVLEIFISQGGNCEQPRLIRPQEVCGINWNGEPEAITRIVCGFGTQLPRVLEELGVPPEQTAQAMSQIQARLEAFLAIPAMPIQDAIDLTRFLVEATIMFKRFSPGAPTVGGPVEVAAITKHEGFKWVERKYYFDSRINPKEDQ